MRIIRSMPPRMPHLPLPPGVMPPDSTASDDACYLALKTRDARFDGRFFTAVTSTGIYCRPVCKVRCPKRENCRFFPLAAQAEQAGFRPCLRCRPELAPSGSLQGAWPEGGAAVWSVQDASSILAQQAARLLDAPDAWSDGLTSMTALAERLGVSERHVRRIFEAHWGVSPLQYWQTRRLLTAKQLLTDTHLPVAQVAVLERLCQRAPVQRRLCGPLPPATTRHCVKRSAKTPGAKKARRLRRSPGAARRLPPAL